MIENTFRHDDTLAQRVEKFNRQTGLDCLLRRDGLGRFYLQRGGRYFTGAMGAEELLDWCATYAGGFRAGASDSESLLRAWRACMAKPRPSDWEQLVPRLLEDQAETIFLAACGHANWR